MIRLIAVTGGIGSGKSVVCRVLATMGFEVYDCDSRAKRIMDADYGIKRRIACEISPLAVDASGNLDRRKIAEIVFSDNDALRRLNGIVHGAVINDIRRNAAGLEAKGTPVLFVETAILHESGLDELVDSVWEVVAPRNLRIKRAVLRDNAGVEAIEARVQAQEKISRPRTCPWRELINDDVNPLLPQIISALIQEGMDAEIS